MMRPLSPILLLLLAASTAWACSCGNYEPVKACEVLATVPVIFRGRVIDHNDNPRLGFVQWTLYRVQVLEAFKGVPAGVKEVFIDPGSMTSCYSSLPTDGELLVYAGASTKPLHFEQFYQRVKDSKGRDGSVKPLPPAWASLGGLPIFYGQFCLPSRRVEPNDPNLAYLRQAAAGQLTGGTLEGWVAQSGSRTTAYAERVPLPGAMITVTGGAGPRRTLSGADGRYRIEGLTPGDYSVTIEKPGYTTTTREPDKFTMALGSCHIERTTLHTSASISGVVLGQNGLPARTVRVELGRLGDDGQARYLPYYWAESDSFGRFEFKNVPAGVRVVAGLNIGGSPSKREPFDAAYAPGHSALTKARVFELRPDEQVSGVSLRVPPSVPFGKLLVDVLWPDGSPAIGARASAAWKSSQSAFENALKESHRVELPLALGREYQVSADFISDRDGQFRSTRSSATTVLFRADGQRVSITLKEKID